MHQTRKLFSRLFIVLFCCCLFFSSAIAQNNSSNLVLMALSAHPDDEDGATLAYYAKLKHIKTYSVFYTRGEGGQNEIGSQLYDDLGELRTTETKQAAEILGSEVLFLGFPDFGFSKTAKETFAMWGGTDSVLVRLVYVIRALKPDIIITNHDTVTTKPGRQHGNHQAVGITAYEAFFKAADPSYHPEQLGGNIGTWQVKKLYFRYFNRDSQQKKDSLVTIDVGQKDNSGQTIEQISMTALSKHRSQGMDKFSLDSLPSFFRRHLYYSICAAQQFSYDGSDFFSGILPGEKASPNIASLQFRPVVHPQPQPNDPATLNIHKPENVTIGLINTYDNTLEQVFKALSINFSLIDSSLLASGDLNKFTTILLDLRTYLYRTDAARYNERLLEYVRNGGNIVCFYHKTGDWNGKNLAPYPITLTSERVTEEDAPAHILMPEHPFFTTPNKINVNDWSGWVQERNIYLPSDDTTKTSASYQRLLAMSDTDDQQPPTSLLYAQYGKGTYTYVSLALYRQVRIYHEGGIKLLMNLIAQPKKP